VISLQILFVFSNSDIDNNLFSRILKTATTSSITSKSNSLNSKTLKVNVNDKDTDNDDKKNFFFIKEEKWIKSKNQISKFMKKEEKLSKKLIQGKLPNEKYNLKVCRLAEKCEKKLDFMINDYVNNNNFDNLNDEKLKKKF
jgi:hypothetical protein